MTRASRAVMLAALCLGVLLVGIELFITAVALPQIFFDLSGWSELRRASWIVTAYLVAYIAAMPLAGRAADRRERAAKSPAKRGNPRAACRSSAPPPKSTP